MNQIEKIFREMDAMLIHYFLVVLLTEFIRTENWEGIAIMIDLFENMERNSQVKKCNEYLKLHPDEIRYP